MQPKIKYNGGLINVVSIWWGDEGEVRHVAFDYKGELKTIFNDVYDFDEILVWD
jgi:hypothetical protein